MKVSTSMLEIWMGIRGKISKWLIYNVISQKDKWQWSFFTSVVFPSSKKQRKRGLRWAFNPDIRHIFFAEIFITCLQWYKAFQELYQNPQKTSANSTCGRVSNPPATDDKVRKAIVKAIVQKSTDPGKITTMRVLAILRLHLGDLDSQLLVFFRVCWKSCLWR